MLMLMAGLALIAFVDIALGLVIAHLLGHAWYGELNHWVYVAGPLLVLLPDADYLFQPLIERLRRDRLISHRQIFHYPLALVPIFLAVHWYHPFAAWLTLLCVGAHFVHDSIGNLYGIQWLWPFSSVHVSALSRDLSGRRRPIQFYTHHEIVLQGRLSLKAFVRERYLGLTPHVACAVLSLAGAIMLVLML